MTNLYFSPEKVRAMRIATKLAIGSSKVTDQSDQDAIGRCVIMACSMGMNCPNEMAVFALRRFSKLGNAIPFADIRALLLAPPSSHIQIADISRQPA